MKIAICDDNPNDILAINNILKSYSVIKESNIDTYTSSEKLLRCMKHNIKYDFAFLDVDMPGINGIELGKAIKNISPKTFIVFVTSYPQYAIEAYDCEAFNYLLKPVDIGKANKVIRNLIRKYQENNKYHIIKIKTEHIRIPIQDIYYIECCRKHIIYHLKTKDYETVGNLSDVYKSLKKHGFYQTHQGYLVNMNRISYFDKYSAILDDDRSVMISVRKRSDVLLAYTKYIQEV